MGQIGFHETSARNNHYTLCVIAQKSTVVIYFAAEASNLIYTEFQCFIEYSFEEAATVFLKQSLLYSQNATQASAVAATKTIVRVLNHGLVILSKHVAFNPLNTELNPICQ